MPCVCDVWGAGLPMKPEKGSGILMPCLLVKIDRQKPACLIRQQRICADGEFGESSLKISNSHWPVGLPSGSIAVGANKFPVHSPVHYLGN